jgi:hypothetical protein
MESLFLAIEIRIWAVIHGEVSFSKCGIRLILAVSAGSNCEMKNRSGNTGPSEPHSSLAA